MSLARTNLFIQLSDFIMYMCVSFQVISHDQKRQSLILTTRGASQVKVAEGGGRDRRRGSLVMNLLQAVLLQAEVARVKKMIKVGFCKVGSYTVVLIFRS